MVRREKDVGAHISRSTKDALWKFELLVGLNYGALPLDNQLQFTTQLSGALKQSGVFGGREEALTQALEGNPNPGSAECISRFLFPVFSFRSFVFR